MPSEVTKTSAPGAGRSVGRWRIEVVTGPSRGRLLRLSHGRVRVGTDPDNEMVVEDPRVSRRHLEIELRPDGLRARDLGSKNGTFYERSRIESAELPLGGAVLQLGDTEVRIGPDEVTPPPLAPSVHTRCGRLVGKSERMREMFGRIERIAPSSATVLVQGETGSGKELVAEAIHDLSARRDGPFVIVDCAAIPAELIESELFGHVRGAFTGAVSDRRGAFEQADRGTIFLDEIGELAPALQPKLLRVLESGRFKPVGGERPVTSGCRVIAATLRDLEQEVRAGRFREDLYFRLSVVRIDVPPLRDHLEDMPLLVERFLADLGAPPLGAEAMDRLLCHDWPGNVRQLRNVLERATALAGGGPLTIAPTDLSQPSALLSPSTLLSLPYKEAKEELFRQFQCDYLVALLQRHGGNVSAAAREAKIDRNWILALARRHGLRVRD